MCNGNQSNFANKGVELQMNAQSWWSAKRNYLYSCMLCCSRGLNIRCDSCPIREAMLVNAEIFSEKMDNREKEWVANEKELL